jgi:hypothetical protein
MKKILSFAAILLMLTSAFTCGKEEKKEDQLLDLGTYVETNPIEGRTRINFIDGEKLVIIKSEKSITEFRYVINEDDDIELTLIADPSMVSKFYFKMINKFKFEIENLYPTSAIGGGKKVIMIFEKENALSN